MSEPRLEPARRPTMYFIGVTTGKSMILRVFPAWARHLGLGDCELRGIDLAIHDKSERYREVVRFIKEDPLSLGALVTTHKIDLYQACRDLFDGVDTFAELMGEASSLAKRDGGLFASAKDAITSGLALEAFLPAGYWEQTAAEAFVMGAGGSAVALTAYLASKERGANRPRRIYVSNRSRPRLESMERIHRRLAVDLPIERVWTPRPEDNDAVLARLAPRSLVVNATGLGKDAPGSPITDAAVFPRGGIAWDFNYRGDLVFLRQARSQQESRGLQIEDGWRYFVYGWLAVIADVFHREIPLRGPGFEELAAIAERLREA